MLLPTQPLSALSWYGMLSWYGIHEQLLCNNTNYAVLILSLSLSQVVGDYYYQIMMGALKKAHRHPVCNLHHFEAESACLMSS